MTPIQQDDYARVYNLKILELGKMILAIAAPIIIGLVLFFAFIALNFFLIADEVVSGGMALAIIIAFYWINRWHRKQLEEYSAWRKQFYALVPFPKTKWNYIVIPIVVVGLYFLVFYLVTIFITFESMILD